MSRYLNRTHLGAPVQEESEFLGAYAKLIDASALRAVAGYVCDFGLLWTVETFGR